MPESTTRPTVIAAVAVTVIAWSSAFIAIRYDGRHFGPGELALGRLLVGSVALGAAVLVRRERMPPRSTWLGTIICGVGWFGIYNVALNAAERHLDAGISALLVNVSPIFIAVLAGVFLKEGFPRLLFVGCVISFAGVAVIGFAGAKHHADAVSGVLLCLVAAVGYAGGIVAEKPVLKNASPLVVTWLACTVGAVCCLPWAPGLIDQLSRASAGEALWIVYLGVFPTATGFLAWAFALSHTSAGRLAPFTYLVPPLALLLGWPILSETPPLLAIPGGILCIAGVAIARWQPARRSYNTPTITSDALITATTSRPGSRPS
ncbi:MAG TPA: DMT family transporter [Solirubrobacteraceae bacterium]|nr:DMT family transporter [Solirubrobacteraceae bacterium]